MPAFPICRAGEGGHPADATVCHKGAEEQPLQKLSELIGGNDLIVAPVALNPIMARMAEEAGFKAGYLSGGSLGSYNCLTYAHTTMLAMAQDALDMRAACKLPFVLDAGTDIEHDR